MRASLSRSKRHAYLSELGAIEGADEARADVAADESEWIRVLPTVEHVQRIRVPSSRQRKRLRARVGEACQHAGSVDARSVTRQRHEEHLTRRREVGSPPFDPIGLRAAPASARADAQSGCDDRSTKRAGACA